MAFWFELLRLVILHCLNQTTAFSQYAAAPTVKKWVQRMSQKTEESPLVKTHQALGIQYRSQGKNDIGSTKNWLVRIRFYLYFLAKYLASRMQRIQNHTLTYLPPRFFPEYSKCIKTFTHRTCIKTCNRQWCYHRQICQWWQHWCFDDTCNTDSNTVG